MRACPEPSPLGHELSPRESACGILPSAYLQILGIFTGSVSPTLEWFCGSLGQKCWSDKSQWRMGSRDNLFRSSDKIQGVSRLFKGFSQPGHMSRSCSGNSLNLKVLTRYVLVAQDHFVVVHNRSIGKSPVNHLLNIQRLLVKIEAMTSDTLNL